MTKMRTDLNRVALWQPKNVDAFTVREYAPGREYFKNNVAIIATAPLYRYAKNYTAKTNGKPTKFCLFIVTKSNASDNIEAFLDATAKEINPELLDNIDNGSFLYLDIFYNDEEPNQ